MSSGLAKVLEILLHRFLPKKARRLESGQVEALFQAMRRLFQDTEILVSPGRDPTDDRLYERARDSFEEFTALRDRHRIGLPSKASRKIDDLIEAIRKPLLSIQFHRGRADRDPASWQEAWIQASQDFEQLAKPAYIAAEKALRKLWRKGDCPPTRDSSAI